MQSVEQFPYYADAHYHACRLLGRAPEAKDACKRYLALEPHGEFAKDAEKRIGGKGRK